MPSCAIMNQNRNTYSMPFLLTGYGVRVCEFCKDCYHAQCVGVSDAVADAGAAGDRGWAAQQCSQQQSCSALLGAGSMLHSCWVLGCDVVVVCGLRRPRSTA